MKRLLIAGLVLLALIVGFTRLRSRPKEELRLAGVVSANEAIVSSEIPGRLSKLLVTEGDAVTKGQVVAVLVADELEAQRANKRALIEQYTAKLEQAEERVRLERGRVASRIESALAQVKALESQRAENIAEMEHARSELVRSNELVEEGLIARQQQERQETTVQVAEARLRSLEDRIDAARAEVEVYRASEREIRVAEQAVEQTKAQKAQAKAELDRIEVRLGHTELKSPLTGIVSIRAAREGEFVAAGTPVVTVVDVNDTWVRAQVEETYISSFVLGQELNVRLASDEDLVGKVTFISPEAEFATQRDVNRVKRDIRTFGVKIALANPEGRVHAGMTAFVHVPYDGRDSRPATSPRSTSLQSSPATEIGTLVPEASAATAPSPAPSWPKPQPGPATPDPPAANWPEWPEWPEWNDTQEHPMGGGDPERAPSRPMLQGVPATTSSTSEHPANEGSLPLSIEELTERVESADASEADVALLEAYMTSEINDEGLRWPEPSAAVATPARSNTSAETASQSQAPEFRLEAVSIIDGKPAAIINGTRVFEGQTIGEAEVLRIREDMVQLRYRGRLMTIRF